MDPAQVQKAYMSQLAKSPAPPQSKQSKTDAYG